MAVWLLGRELLLSKLFFETYEEAMSEETAELVSFTDADIEDTPLCIAELSAFELVPFSGRIILHAVAERKTAMQKQSERDFLSFIRLLLSSAEERFMPVYIHSYGLIMNGTM